MTYTQYQRRRNAAANRLAMAFAAGNAAVASGDWRKMSAALKECDAAYLALCAVQAQANEVTP